jgi:glutathione S-transferase
LALHSISHTEERHSLLICGIANQYYKGEIPFYVLNGEAVGSAKNILNSLDDGCPADKKLVPPEHEQEVRAAFDEYNGVMGVSMAQWVYYYVLQLKELANKMMTEGTEFWEVALNYAAFPLVAGIMKKGLKDLDANVAQKALETNKRILDAADAKLADGRPFLIGDRITAADLSFCAATAPLMLDSQYGGALPTIDEVQPEMQAEVREFRQRESARFVQRLYSEYRTSTPQT